MDARTLGKIYRLIQDDYTNLALKACRDKEKRKALANTCRKTADLFKHDICRFVDAEAEKARRLLEDEEGLKAHCVYPPEDEDFDDEPQIDLDMAVKQGMIQEAIEEAVEESIQEIVQEIVREITQETTQE